MLVSNAFPPTISQMTAAEREKVPMDSQNKAWTTSRILFQEPFDPSKKAWEVKSSYENEVEGLHHKPHYQFFKNCVRSLQDKDIWFDAGCGQGVALVQYVKEFENGATVYGVTLTRPSNKEDEEKMIEADRKYQRLHIYFHDFLSLSTISLQGRARVITDIYGSFNYSGRPSEVLSKFAAMLTVDGTLFLKFSSTNTVNVARHEKSISAKEILSRGSEAFFFLYLSTVRGFKVIAPESVSPDAICKLFSPRATSEELSNMGYWDRSWIMVRTNETFDADPLYVEGDNVQCDDSILSSHKYRKYHWEISQKNKPFVDSMKDVSL
jgi:hypothetical protein